MTAIAIVGAGAGLGAAIARRFGAEGFGVALISRDQEKLDRLAVDLVQEGLTARGFAASVRDPQALTAALSRAAEELGPIEILEYSPLPQKEFLRPVLDTTVDDLTAAMEFSVYGPVTAVHQVLDGMRELGRGTVLFVNGGSAVQPNASYAGTSAAFAAESALASMLHDSLAAENINVGQLIIPGAIEAGHPNNDPDVLAERLWQQHAVRGEFRAFAEPLTAEK
ncbi:SDR family NAD(P)-dependent oxidoreductase [Microbacterium sp. P05]|uniref:SDR family NAD(P)-dependent oxidoreductase n=1 Tax=Microbacterium sp. P05 TaxID=3366948 RepID=UPI003744DFBE